jgi:hypothetical protein
MTPKEKARDLVSSFYYALPNNGGFTGLNSTTSRYQEGIRCALIAVDEILNELSPLELHPLGTYTNPKIKYFEEVKQEIEKIEKL